MNRRSWATSRRTAIGVLAIVLLLSQAAAEEADEEGTARKAKQLPDFLQDGLSGAGGRVGFRLKLIFPLILAIATRLGSLVPIGLSVLGGVAIMAAFAKKAFIVSLITLALFLWEKWAAKYHHQKHRAHVRHVPAHVVEHPEPTVATWAAATSHHHMHWPSLVPPPPPRDHHQQVGHNHHEDHDWDSSEHFFSDGIGGNPMLLHHGDHDHFVSESSALLPQRQRPLPPPPLFFHTQSARQEGFHPLPSRPTTLTPPLPPPTAGGRKARRVPPNKGKAQAGPQAPAPAAAAPPPPPPPAAPSKQNGGGRPEKTTFPHTSTTLRPPPPIPSSTTPAPTRAHTSPASITIAGGVQRPMQRNIIPRWSTPVYSQEGTSVWRRSGEPWEPVMAVAHFGH